MRLLTCRLRQSLLALVLFACTLNIPSISHGAIAFDNATNCGATGATTCTWSHTTTAGASVIIIGVVPATGGGPASGTITGVTYNGTALAKVAGGVSTGTDYRYEQWCLDSPSSGAHNAVATISAVSGPTDTLTATAITLTGTTNCASISKTNTAQANATSVSTTVASVVSGEWVLDVACEGSSIDTVGADQTSRTLNNFSTHTACGNIASSTQLGSLGGVMSWSSVTSDFWGISALAIGASGGGPTTKIYWGD